MDIIKEKRDTCSSYFAKPRREREKWGFWYIEPEYRFFNLDDLKGTEENKWKIEIVKQYPIQAHLRFFWEFLDSVFWRTKYKIEHWYRWIFKPQHRDIAAAVPRTWYDCDHVMEQVNFAIIKSFYNEATESCVDWSEGKHKEFMDWLTFANQYVTIERAKMEKIIEEKYGDFKIDYKEILELENILEKSDTDILVGLVRYRGFMWT